MTSVHRHLVHPNGLTKTCGPEDVGTFATVDEWREDSVVNLGLSTEVRLQ